MRFTVCSGDAGGLSRVVHVAGAESERKKERKKEREKEDDREGERENDRGREIEG